MGRIECGCKLVTETHQDGSSQWREICDTCKRDIPWPLLKAQDDEFDYAVKLRTGEVVRFSSAEIGPVWVTLLGGGYADPNEKPVKGVMYPCPCDSAAHDSDAAFHDHCADCEDADPYDRDTMEEA